MPPIGKVTSYTNMLNLTLAVEPPAEVCMGKSTVGMRYHLSRNMKQASRGSPQPSDLLCGQPSLNLNLHGGRMSSPAIPCHPF